MGAPLNSIRPMTREDTRAQTVADIMSQIAMGDVEFEADVWPHLDETGKLGFDAKRAIVSPANTNARGVYFPSQGEGSRPDNSAADIVERYGGIPERDQVVAFNGSATPELWAHEFGHRGQDMLAEDGRMTDTMSNVDEAVRRVYDHSQGDPQAEMFMEQMYNIKPGTPEWFDLEARLSAQQHAASSLRNAIKQRRLQDDGSGS